MSPTAVETPTSLRIEKRIGLESGGDYTLFGRQCPGVVGGHERGQALLRSLLVVSPSPASFCRHRASTPFPARSQARATTSRPSPNRSTTRSSSRRFRRASGTGRTRSTSWISRSSMMARRPCARRAFGATDRRSRNPSLRSSVAYERRVRRASPHHAGGPGQGHVDLASGAPRRPQAWLPLPELLGGQFGEPPFDQVQPGAIRGGEVHVKPRPLGQPRANVRRLVRPVVVHDEMHVDLARYAHLGAIEEGPKLEGPMSTRSSGMKPMALLTTSFARRGRVENVLKGHS